MKALTVVFISRLTCRTRKIFSPFVPSSLPSVHSCLSHSISRWHAHPNPNPFQDGKWAKAAGKAQPDHDGHAASASNAVSLGCARSHGQTLQHACARSTCSSP